jgi:uncharacterized membrane protein HdeD (DUF308 family)
VSSEPLSQPPPERLSIGHLLVWTTMCAVLLGFQRAMSSREPGLAFFSDVVAFLKAPLFGAGLGACLLAVWRIVYGGPQFPRQPGHWLLVVSGLRSIDSLAFLTLISLSRYRLPVLSMLLGIQLVLGGATAVCFAMAARDVRGIWRLVMFWGHCSSLIMLLATFGMLRAPNSSVLHSRLDTALYCLLSAATFVAAMNDLYNDKRRDFLHWTGVMTRLAYTVLIVAIPFIIHWLQRPSP